VVSPEEVLAATIARIEALNPAVNAYHPSLLATSVGVD
jgi:Asp-tRNA(Asn)/Glu-tRNA(Gln) amidotransferase A subunit family amidase